MLAIIQRPPLLRGCFCTQTVLYSYIFRFTSYVQNECKKLYNTVNVLFLYNNIIITVYTCNMIIETVNTERSLMYYHTSNSLSRKRPSQH